MRISRSSEALLAWLTLWVVLAWAAAPALADGGLDPSFGEDGRVADSTPLHEARLTDLAIDERGGIVAVGTDYFNPFIVRHNADGTLDGSLHASLPWRSYTGDPDSISSVSIDGAGRIVAAGTAAGGAVPSVIAVARLLPDGSPDRSFGDAGVASVDIPEMEFEHANDVAVDSAGRVVVAGDAIDLSDGRQELAIVRFTESGRLDPSFGLDGLVLTHFFGVHYSEANAVGIDPAGRIVVAGRAEQIGGAEAGLVRLEEDGSLDPRFSGDGKVLLDPGGDWSEAVDFEFDESGRIVVVGSRHGGNVPIFVARLREDGSLDLGFGNEGMATLQRGGTPTRVALDKARRIVIAGTPEWGAPFLLRLHPDGLVDESFGSDGVVTQSYFERQPWDSPWPAPVEGGSGTGLAIDREGRYVLGGSTRWWFRGMEAMGYGIARYLIDYPEEAAGGEQEGTSPGRCSGRQATIAGTPGRDLLKGTMGRDVIAGLRGDDVVRGLGGNDVVCGGPGRDRLFGGKGNDRLFGGKGADLLVGGRGRDLFRDGPGRDTERR